MPEPRQKSVSRKQLVANRRNAKKSCGPRTAAGRKTVSGNALKHGLASRFALLPHEDATAHAAFCREFIREFAPADTAELNLALAIANDLWRLERTVCLENNLFAEAAIGIAPSPGPERDGQIALAEARTFLNRADTLLLISLYEQSLNCAIRKNTARLRLLQSERRQVAENAVDRRMAERLNRELIEIPYSIPFNRLAAIIDPNGFVCANSFSAPLPHSPVDCQKPMAQRFPSLLY